MNNCWPGSDRDPHGDQGYFRWHHKHFVVVIPEQSGAQQDGVVSDVRCRKFKRVPLCARCMPGAEMSLTFNDVMCGNGDTVVIRGISGLVSPGEVLAIVGRNGVGKSTLLKALAGQLPLTSGTIPWNGADIQYEALHKRLGLGIAYTPQENVVFGELSVADNLWLHLADRGMERYRKMFEQFPLLRERLSQLAGSLSGGERKLLSFTRTLGLEAKLAMLDEPTEGVQPENIDRMANLVNSLKAAGSSFIIVEQNLEFVSAIADAVIVLDHGEVVLQGKWAGIGREAVVQHMLV